MRYSFTTYRKVKIAPFRKVYTDKPLGEILRIFNDLQASADADLCHLLYVKTTAKQAVHAKFYLDILPSTSAAACEHSLRVFRQVQEWCGVNMDPLYWGWKFVNSCLCPLPSSMNATPKDLLHLVFSGHGCSNRDVGEDEDRDGDLHLLEQEGKDDVVTSVKRDCRAEAVDSTDSRQREAVVGGPEVRGRVQDFRLQAARARILVEGQPADQKDHQEDVPVISKKDLVYTCALNLPNHNLRSAQECERYSSGRSGSTTATVDDPVSDDVTALSDDLRIGRRRTSLCDNMAAHRSFECSSTGPTTPKAAASVLSNKYGDKSNGNFTDKRSTGVCFCKNR
ncbi:hypothetical protein PR048_019406 [Dryococelus australis]|uniref:Uncharacterized protein n=1 Tax=Dryococelus australis TaxID=614101 RepID=A0ABQ9H3E5_9NEOP|nr:hypothetical protein PR048_019406 [Dryococelus australis]